MPLNANRSLPRAVTFDFWNTLVAEHPDAWRRRIDAQAEALESVGVATTREELEAATSSLRSWFDDRWRANEVVNPEVGAARFVNEIGLDHDETVVAAIAAVYRRGTDPSSLTLAPGIGETLEQLRGEGVVVGIICDTGFAPGVTLRGYLRHHGLLDHFAHQSFSDEVGAFKPDPRMFAHAAAGLGVGSPTDFAHIGDIRRTDVAGAIGAGWTAVRYRGLNDDAPTDEDRADAAIVIDAHAELVDALLR